MWMNHPPIPHSDYEALSEVYRNTLSEATQSGINNLENVSSAISMAKSIATGHVEELFQGLADFARDRSLKNGFKLSQDAWLKYRYLYGTTKMDAEAAVDALLDDKFSTVTDSNVYRGNIAISDGSLRIKLRVHETMDLATRIHNDFKQGGLWPDLYDLWDMVPFSFVVDWFVPDFSDRLEDMSQRYLSEMYIIDELEVTYNRTWSFEDNGITYKCKSYDRSFEFEPPQFEFYEEVHKPRGATVVKRWIDSAALFLSI